MSHKYRFRSSDISGEHVVSGSLGLVPLSELSGVEDSSGESDTPLIVDETIPVAPSIENQLASSVVSNPDTAAAALVNATAPLATVAVDAVASFSIPSLAYKQLVLPAQSDPGCSTLYPAYIDVTAANAMRIASVAATPTADSVIDRQSTSQSDPGQASTHTIIYDTVAMGTGSLPATPPVQSVITAAYTQLGPMDPGHLAGWINMPPGTELGLSVGDTVLHDTYR